MDQIQKFRSWLEAVIEPLNQPKLEYRSRPLCESCCTLSAQIDAILSMEARQPISISELSVDALSFSEPDTCSVCRFFLDLIPAKSPAFRGWISIWLDFSEIFEFKRCISDPNPEPHIRVAYMYVTTIKGFTTTIDAPISFISRKNKSQRLGTVGETVDFSLVNEWLHLCKSNHSCRGPSSENDITLINCTTRKLENKNSTESFIALSYVWGPSGNADQSIESQLANLPPLIEDAVEVCKELGINYLWVDRYCISRDREEFSKQIANMDAIYQQAELTIVAASAENPSSGLPGVKRMKRIPQPSATMNNWQLLQCLPNPQAVVSKSKWNTRGWTYQEGMLSSRRLYFTDQQIYFECQASIYEETSATLCWDDYRPHGWQKACEVGMSRPHMFQSREGMTYATIWKIIEIYSTRSLTYSSDSLNAMLGIFRFLSRRNNEGGKKDLVYHYWGIPINFPLREFANYHTVVESFFQGLAFRTEVGAMQRKDDFPTWSWTKWTGRIIFNQLQQYHIPGTKSNEVTAVQLKNGTRQIWRAFLDNFNTSDPSNLSIYVHVSANVIKLCLIYRPKDAMGPYVIHSLGGIDLSRTGSPSQVYISDIVSSLQPPRSKFHTRILEESLTCLLMIRSDYIFVLILLEENGCFVRIGFTELRLNRKMSFVMGSFQKIVLDDGVNTHIDISLIEYVNLQLG